MKDQTRHKINGLVAKYQKYGVTFFFCADALDNMDYRMSDAQALILLEACIVNQFEPENLTPEQKEIVKYQSAREKINVSHS